MKTSTLALRLLILTGLVLIFSTNGRTQVLSAANGMESNVNSNRFSAVAMDTTYFSIPFLESWDQGSFSIHSWSFLPDQGNWIISTTSGNPVPAAYFSSTPVVHNYDYSLISPMLDASAYSCADIWVYCDLRLDDIHPTGKEKFEIDIKLNNAWINKGEFTNNTGTTTWATYRFKIDTAMGKVFQIRFRATGDSSSNITGWSLDNIHIYAACRGPRNLQSSNSALDTHLTWVPPSCDPTGPESQWIHWDSGINFTSIGYNAPYNFQIAARWTPDQIQSLKGGIITRISFFPSGMGTASFRARIWEGPVDSMNMVTDIKVDSVKYDQWNWVTLTTPVAVNMDSELWIGMDVNASGGWPAGVDAGPAVAGFGDMFNDGLGWVAMSQPPNNLNYNWNLQAYIEPGPGDSQLGSHLLGYNVYRTPDNAASPFNKLNSTIVTDTTFVDSHSPGTLAGTSWKYYVASVYENQAVPGPTLCEGSSDTVSTILNGENELNPGKISVFPNPASGFVNITSDILIDNISLMNCSGEYILNESGRLKKNVVLDLSSFQNGLYFVKITTSRKTFTTKLTILH